MGRAAFPFCARIRDTTGFSADAAGRRDIAYPAVRSFSRTEDIRAVSGDAAGCSGSRIITLVIGICFAQKVIGFVPSLLPRTSSLKRTNMYSIMHLLTEEEGTLALQAARAYMEAAVTHTEAKQFDFPEIFAENRGVFVTLTQAGELRGCIGFPYPTYPLSEAIREAAVAAATQDPRFYPVREEELSAVRVEVTVLTLPEVLDCPAEDRPKHIEIGRHGLIASLGSRSGLLLPQVAEEYHWNAEEFLSQTCVKAGLYHKSWEEDDDCIIKTFEGQIFTE